MTPEALRFQAKNVDPNQPKKTVALNGETLSIPAQATVSELLRTLDLQEERVAVELDGEILKRPKWSTTEPADGARLEVVHFVGGG